MRPMSENHVGAAIVGLGNILLTDDGVGVHAVRRLRRDPPENTTVAEVGTAVLDAVPLLEDVDVIVAIDAVQAGGSPGTVYCFDLDEVDMRQDLSLHDYGIAAAVQAVPSETRPDVTIIGVEPAVLDYGMQLSPAVQAALPNVVRMARTTIAKRINRFSEQQEGSCEKA